MRCLDGILGRGGQWGLRGENRGIRPVSPRARPQTNAHRARTMVVDCGLRTNGMTDHTSTEFGSRCKNSLTQNGVAQTIAVTHRSGRMVVTVG